MPQNKLFGDIDPPIKQALQLRKKKLIDRNMDEFNKSAYVRMVPLNFPDIVAAEQKKNPNTTEEDIIQLYTLGILPTNTPTPTRSYGKKYNRPDTGLTDISIQQEGFSGKGLIKIQAKGIIPTLEQIDFYKPILLTPGRYWLIEWGYQPAKLINLVRFAALSEDEKFNYCERYRKETNGNGEAQIAVVNNFEYNLIESGAFNFSVDFMGNSTLFKRFTSSTESSGFKEIAPRNASPDKSPESRDVEIEETYTPKLGSFLGGVVTGDWEKAKENLPNFQKTGIVDFASAQIQKKTTFTMDSAFSAATPRDFFKNLKEYIIDSAKTISTNEALDEVRDSLIQTIAGGSGEDKDFPTSKQRDYSKFDSIRKFGVYYDPELKPETIAGTKFDYNNFNNELGPYVTWGWMEDNILSVVYSNLESDNSPMKFESTDEDGVPLPLNSHNYLYTSHPNLMIIPGRFPTELERKYKTPDKAATVGYKKEIVVDRGNTYYTKTTDVEQTLQFDEIFLSYHPIVRKYLGISEAALGFDVYRSDDEAGKDVYDGREDKVATSENRIGSIRRLVLHYSLIQSAFQNASTVQEGLKNLFKQVEGMGYTRFWKFDIYETDNKIGCYEVNSLTEKGRKAIEIAKQTIIDSSLQTDTPKAGEPFVFPTWNNEGGFVIQQDLTVKLPTGNMLAMVYGNTLEGKKQIENKALISDTSAVNTFKTINEGGKENESTPSERVKVNPGFQSNEMVIVRNISIDGDKSYRRIAPEFRKKVKYDREFGRTKSTKTKEVERKIVGDTRVKVEAAFKHGVAYDAEGIMYNNFKQTMNYFLQRKFSVKDGLIVELSGGNTQLLDMVELRIRTLGIAGLDWGDQFHTDYIEDRYKKETVFYVSKIEHQIVENKWTTDITGNMRAIYKADYMKTSVAVTDNEFKSLDVALTEVDTRLLEKLGKSNEKLVISKDSRFDYDDQVITSNQQAGPDGDG